MIRKQDLYRYSAQKFELSLKIFQLKYFDHKETNLVVNKTDRKGKKRLN